MLHKEYVQPSPSHLMNDTCPKCHVRFICDTQEPRLILLPRCKWNSLCPIPYRTIENVNVKMCTVFAITSIAITDARIAMQPIINDSYSHTHAYMRGTRCLLVQVTKYTRKSYRSDMSFHIQWF